MIKGHLKSEHSLTCFQQLASTKRLTCPSELEGFCHPWGTTVHSGSTLPQCASCWNPTGHGSNGQHEESWEKWFWYCARFQNPDKRTLGFVHQKGFHWQEHARIYGQNAQAVHGLQVGPMLHFFLFTFCFLYGKLQILGSYGFFNLELRLWLTWKIYSSVL